MKTCYRFQQRWGELGKRQLQNWILSCSAILWLLTKIIWICMTSQWTLKTKMTSIAYINSTKLSNRKVCICILWGGRCPLHVASAEAASRASPTHNPSSGTSVQCCVTPSGWPDGVWEVYSAARPLFLILMPPAYRIVSKWNLLYTISCKCEDQRVSVIRFLKRYLECFLHAGRPSCFSKLWMQQ